MNGDAQCLCFYSAYYTACGIGGAFSSIQNLGVQLLLGVAS